MYQTLYLEITLISCLVALLLLVRSSRSRDRQSASLAYRRVVAATIVVLLLDVAWVFVEGRTGRGLVVLNYLINIIYMPQAGLVGYLWLQFVLCRLHRDDSLKRIVRLALLLPLLLMLILCALTPWTHWLFEIGADNVYRRGPLIHIQQIICYGYMVVSGIYAMYCALRAEGRERRDEALLLSSFIVLPAIGGVLNVLVYGLPVIWPLTVVSLMVVYINLQSQQISTDELTGLNNRRQFDRYLLAQTEDRRRDEQLYLLLLDIDSFKSINDTYGHPTGDRALMQTAAILKRVCSMWSCFLARYGGDEFAVVFRADGPTVLKQFQTDIAAGFDAFNTSGVAPYTLTVSIGTGIYADETGGPTALIALADQSLYEAKTAKKSDSSAVESA